MDKPEVAGTAASLSMINSKPRQSVIGESFKKKTPSITLPAIRQTKLERASINTHELNESTPVVSCQKPNKIKHKASFQSSSSTHSSMIQRSSFLLPNSSNEPARLAADSTFTIGNLETKKEISTGKGEKRSTVLQGHKPRSSASKGQALNELSDSDRENSTAKLNFNSKHYRQNLSKSEQAHQSKSASTDRVKVGPSLKQSDKLELEIITEKLKKKEVNGHYGSKESSNFKNTNKLGMTKRKHDEYARGKSAEAPIIGPGFKTGNMREDKVKKNNKTIDVKLIARPKDSLNFTAPLKSFDKKIIKINNTSPKKKKSKICHLKEIQVSSKRKYSKIDIAMNLFNCWWPLAFNMTTSVKCHFGTGNNITLVSHIFHQRSCVENVISPGNSNLVWTQLICRLMKVTNYFGMKRSFLSDLSTSVLSDQSLLDADHLTDILIESKIFKIPDRDYVRNIFQSVISREAIPSLENNNIVIGNHIRGLFYLTRKYALAKVIKDYCKKNKISSRAVIPKTYLLAAETLDSDMALLITKSREVQESSTNGSWKPTDEYDIPMIIKPGELTNRGKGISIAYNEKELRSYCGALFAGKSKDAKGVVQTYLKHPLLYKNRKFDLRCYALVTKCIDRLVVYWYTQGYARTSSFDYNENDKVNLMVHLTNEAVQVKGSLC